MKTNRVVYNSALAFFGISAILFVGCRSRQGDQNVSKSTVQDQWVSTTLPAGAPYNQIKIGMKSADVFAVLGEPDSIGGSGFVIMQYKLSPNKILFIQTNGVGGDGVVYGVQCLVRR